MLLLMLFSSLSLVLVRPLVSLSPASPTMTTPPLCCLTMLDHVVSVPSSSANMNDIKKLIIVHFYGPNEAVKGRLGRKYPTFWDFCEQFNFLQCGGHENKIQKLGRILLEHNEAAAPEPGFVSVTGWRRHFDRLGDKTNSSWKTSRY